MSKVRSREEVEDEIWGCYGDAGTSAASSRNNVDNFIWWNGDNGVPSDYLELVIFG